MFNLYNLEQIACILNDLWYQRLFDRCDIPGYSYCRNVKQGETGLAINQDREYLTHKTISTAKYPIPEKIFILNIRFAGRIM